MNAWTLYCITKPLMYKIHQTTFAHICVVSCFPFLVHLVLHFWIPHHISNTSKCYSSMGHRTVAEKPPKLLKVTTHCKHMMEGWMACENGRSWIGEGWKVVPYHAPGKTVMGAVIWNPVTSYDRTTLSSDFV